MKRKTIIQGLLAAAIVVIAVSGCPNPIDDQVFLQMTDRNPPTVDISTPADNTPYTQSVTVQGTALDAEGRLKGITWTVTGVLGLLEEHEIAPSDISASGVFTFQFSTLSYTGPIAVTVKATDWNDNVGQAILTLTEPNSQLSSFTAEPANKKVTLDWEEVSGATYTIYYTRNGTLPSETYGTQVSVSAPPCDVTGLTNGAMHVFLLKASASGKNYWSSYVYAIPLSPFTLAPGVTGGYRKLKLEWASISATDEFEVWRSTSAAGPFTNHTGIIRGTTWTDTGVPDDTWYFYKVRPAVDGGLLSTYGSGQTVPLPLSAQDRIVSLATPGSASQVKTSGNYAFIAAKTSGLVVVDISDIRDPVVVATRPTVNALDIELYGNCAYVADGTGGLKIFDIAVPSSPNQIGATNGGGLVSATRIAVAGGPTGGTPYARAYVLDASGNTAIRVYDVTLPSSPSWLSDYTEPGYEFRDVTASYGDFINYRTLVYTSAVNSSDGSGMVFESYTPDPLYKSVTHWRQYTYYDSNPSNHWRPFHLAVSAGKLYTASDLGVSTGLLYTKLLVLNRYPLSFTLTGEVDDIVGMASGVAVNGNRAYATNSTGLQIYDVSNPSAPVALEYLDMPGISEGVDTSASGSHAFVVSGVLGFHIVDLASQQAPTTAGTWSLTSGGTHGLAVRGGYAYVAASNPAALKILDVRNPASVVERGSLSFGSPSAVAVTGDWAFVANGNPTHGLAVVDVSDPSLPVLRGSTPLLGGSGMTIKARGDYAYVAGSNGLQIFDIGDPAAPVPVGFFNGETQVAGVDVRGSLAYITDGSMFMGVNYKLRIVDISVPSSPFQVDMTPGPDFTIDPEAVTVAGDFAYIADSNTNRGTFAVDINPSSPNYLEHWALCNTSGSGFGNAYDIVVYGDRAYVADGSLGTGMAVVDISDLGTPVNTFDPARLLSGLSWANAKAESIVLSGRYAYVTDTNQAVTPSLVGLKIIEILH